MRKGAVAGSVLLFVMTFALFIQLVPAAACTGSGCRGLDPIDAGCAVNAVTVYYWLDRSVSGSYGEVETDLRWKSTCIANWARGWVRANNSNTKYLYAKVWEKYLPSWNYYYYIQGNPLAVGSYTWTDMVSGADVSVAFAGIAKTSWSGPYNPSYQYEG